MPIQHSHIISGKQLRELSKAGKKKKCANLQLKLGIPFIVKSFTAGGCGCGSLLATSNAMFHYICIEELLFGQRIPKEGTNNHHYQQLFELDKIRFKKPVVWLLENQRIHKKQPPIPVFWQPLDQSEMSQVPVPGPGFVYVGHWKIVRVKLFDDEEEGEGLRAQVQLSFSRFDRRMAKIINFCHDKTCREIAKLTFDDVIAAAHEPAPTAPGAGAASGVAQHLLEDTTTVADPVEDACVFPKDHSSATSSPPQRKNFASSNPSSVQELLNRWKSKEKRKVKLYQKRGEENSPTTATTDEEESSTRRINFDDADKDTDNNEMKEEEDDDNEEDNNLAKEGSTNEQTATKTELEDENTQSAASRPRKRQRIASSPVDSKESQANNDNEPDPSDGEEEGGEICEKHKEETESTKSESGPHPPPQQQDGLAEQSSPPQQHPHHEDEDEDESAGETWPAQQRTGSPVVQSQLVPVEDVNLPSQPPPPPRDSPRQEQAAADTAVQSEEEEQQQPVAAIKKEEEETDLISILDTDDDNNNSNNENNQMVIVKQEEEEDLQLNGEGRMGQQEQDLVSGDEQQRQKQICRYLTDEVIGSNPSPETMAYYARKLYENGFQSVEMIQTYLTSEDIHSFHWMIPLHRRIIHSKLVGG